MIDLKKLNFSHGEGFHIPYRVEKYFEMLPREMKEEHLEGYTREKVIEQLKELSNVVAEVEENKLFYCEHPRTKQENYCGVYLASPVFLAVLLKEYELAEKLIDQNYYANDLFLGDQCYYQIDIGYRRCVEITITQLLMSQYDIPDRLLKKIQGQLLTDDFCFMSDYWCNPFLMTSNDIAERKTIPSMKGFESLRTFDNEIFRGMMDGVKTQHWYNYEVNTTELKKLVRGLLVSFYGLAEDLEKIIERYGISGMPYIGYQEKKTWYRFWFGMLPELKNACPYNEQWQKTFFEYVVKLYSNILSDEELLGKKKMKEYLEILNPYLKENCPEDYGIEEYLEWIYKHKHQTQYARMLAVWKYRVKKSVCVGRGWEILWKIMENLLGEKVFESDEDDYEMCENLRDHLAPERIADTIQFLELIEIVEEEYAEKKEVESSWMGYLFSALMDFSSEELMLTCLKCGLIPKEAVGALIKASNIFKGRKLLPVLIMYQSQLEKRGENYV